MNLDRAARAAWTIGASLAIASITTAAEPPAGHRQISGVYPHLTTYGIYSQDGAHLKGGHNECGIGAVVPWAGKLWMINYAPHMPRGSEHKLYSIDQRMNLTIHPESVGGTPAGRMIHRESNQLLIGPYLIDAKGEVRVIPPSVMPGRLTAIMRHLEDPANMVYYFDMEGALYEADVHTLAVKKLFSKPIPGWHGKGGYTSQGRLVLANNGEHASGSYKGLLVGGPAKNAEEAGALAEWDGNQWRIVERRQYTDVTGPGGIHGAPDDTSPLWAIGWDRRSLRLKLLERGRWHTFLLPKATHNNDPKHGWYTEWPRIREIGKRRIVMDMHGMFFDFPKTFSAANTAGLRPIASHLRYIPDFCDWNGQVVLASDETSIQGNPLAGQPQSNLWFGTLEQLRSWGPASGYGGPWIADAVKAGEPSDPFLVNGFDRRVLHLAVGGNRGPVRFTLEIDVDGRGIWRPYRTIEVPSQGYVYHVFPADFHAQWVRLKTDGECVATAYFHLTDADLHDALAGKELFAGLAEAHAPAAHAALVYAAKRNRNLRVITGDGRFLEFDKRTFTFRADEKDERLAKLLQPEPEFTVDDASVILIRGKVRLRLPKGPAAFDRPFASGPFAADPPRGSREVESERHLANFHGTFYEAPLITNGRPPAFELMRPVASHAKQISDFCSWNGLLVLAGVSPNAAEDGHVFTEADGTAALWFGGVDDLWKLGKPVGRGGPWKNTAIGAGEHSDPYLMTGYDRKTLSLSADRDVTISVEVDFDHQSGWHTFRRFAVKAGETVSYCFPAGFSAHWIRTIADADCTATAWLVYE